MESVHEESSIKRARNEEHDPVPDTDMTGCDKSERQDEKKMQSNSDSPLENMEKGESNNAASSRRKEAGRAKNKVDKRNLIHLRLLLSEQEETFENEEEGLVDEKRTAKKQVADVFKTLREILSEKEKELLGKIESEYTVASSFLADSLIRIRNEKQNVNEMISNFKDSAKEGTDLDMVEVTKSIDKNVESRNDVLNLFHVPYIVPDKRSIETLKELSFAELKEIPPSVTDQMNTFSCSEESATDEDEEEDTASEGGEKDVGGTSKVSGNALLHAHRRGKRFEAGGASGMLGEKSAVLAPPIIAEELPPAYWQAIGVEGPKEEDQDQDNKNFRLPENKLEFSHSFSILRQHGRRFPAPVALTWNCGRICIIDKANKRVEFFYPDGKLITETVFQGAELRDVTFLDETYNGEHRYVVLNPRKKTLYIISIDAQNTPKLFQKIHCRQRYMCMCRGPRIQTIVGAELSSTTGAPTVVNMFTLSGKVLLSISCTPGFALWQYIKKVQVFGSNIIILDCKINLVAVYKDDGSAVGEYRGTEESPLINPPDMALDHHGNVLILNGGFQNIHVIDLECDPLEIIELPSDISPSASRLKLIAFDLESHRLCIARSNGEIAIFTFKTSYDSLPQGKFPQLLMLPHQNTTNKEIREPEVVPLVEGVIPSTIETMINRQTARHMNLPYNS